MNENNKNPNKEFGERKKYKEPTLRKMGTMQRVTMGGTSAPFDSGTNGFAESTTSGTNQANSNK